MDRIQLATTVPLEEECIQLGQPNYSAFSKIEANVLMNQIIREHGLPPKECKMKLVTCPHDFGKYYDIEIEYNDDDFKCESWALDVVNSLPEKWDEISLKALKKEGYHL